MAEPGNRPADIVRPLMRVRQVRDFTEAAVTAEQIDAIADAGRWSGSSQNAQPWRLIAIRDTATIRRIADAAMPGSRSLQTAAAAIAIASPDDPGHAVKFAYDEARVAERILIAATLLGLGAGISWVASEYRVVLGEILGLPEGRFVRTIVALGHPTEAALKPKSEPGKARLPRSEVVFEERWPKE